MYSPQFDVGWKRRFDSLDNSIKMHVAKKVKQILGGLPGRHLQSGVDYFVEEVGQFRIAYKSFEERMVRRFYFVGTHKEYMKWIAQNADRAD